jgi:hypothetical protein
MDTYCISTYGMGTYGMGIKAMGTYCGIYLHQDFITKI